jgi:hypothetical protein
MWQQQEQVLPDAVALPSPLGGSSATRRMRRYLDYTVKSSLLDLFWEICTPGASPAEVPRRPLNNRTRIHFRLVALALRSRSRRSAVRFFAAAADASFARADRSSGVELRAAFFPPCLPNSRAISNIAARTSAGIFTPMPFRLHLTGYGEIVARFPLIP